MKQDMSSKPNPFYFNPVFNKEDISRAKISYLDYPSLIFKTTYVQISDGYVFKFKRGSNGQIFIMGFEEL